MEKTERTKKARRRITALLFLRVKYNIARFNTDISTSFTKPICKFFNAASDGDTSEIMKNVLFCYNYIMAGAGGI